jgi:hypothetical protein
MKKICAAVMALTFVLLLLTVSSAQRRHKSRGVGTTNRSGVVDVSTGEANVRERHRRSFSIPTKGDVSLAKHRRHRRRHR